MAPLPFIVLFFFLSVFPVFGDENLSLVEFAPKAAMPETGFTLGKAVLTKDGRKYSSLGFQKADEIFVLVPEDLSSGDFPSFQIDSLGFYKGRAIVGGFEFPEGRGAWILLFSFSGGPAVDIVDVVKHGALDGYAYDFYFNLPPVDAPKNITDADGDGLPEIELDFYLRKFRLLMEPSERGLHIDYSSPTYGRVYDKVRKTDSLDEYQFREHLLYGIITGRISEKGGVEKYLGKNDAERANAPAAEEGAVELKKAADKLGATELVAAYFAGQMEMADVVSQLKESGDADPEFLSLLTGLEKRLNSAQLDEVAFNDFVSYFSGSISEKEFRKSVRLSLASSGGDVYSILTNYRDVDKALHSAGKFKIMKFDSL